MKNNFLGRSLAVIGDLSLDERIFLFQKAKEIKDTILATKKCKLPKCILDKYRIDDRDLGVYEVFLEDSTRTKESFWNAGQFHGVKLRTFDSTHSSFNKGESYADAFLNIAGYDNSIFIVRSKLEGLCRWLEIKGKEYVENEDLDYLSFINGGDGKHEHPTQELLDDFTFLEDNDWKRDSIHIALIGDLLHGRTVHSKVEGLKVFGNVKVDLIAPKELEMPDSYINRMAENDFEIRLFPSIEQYIGKGTALKWYFTRPQLERMGKDVLDRADELRKDITFRKEFLDKIEEGTRFYHPLPRKKECPVVPPWLDKTKSSAYFRQSANGRYVRIALLGMFAGLFGDDFQGETVQRTEFEDDFIDEVNAESKVKEYSEGIRPIAKGICIDHICKGENPAEIWEYLTKMISIIEADDVGYVGVDKSKKEGVYKGMIFLPNRDHFSEHNIKKLAAISPCSYNEIKGHKVTRKLRLRKPPRIYNFEEISCKNEACISYPAHFEGAPSEFHRKDDDFVCMYCDAPHTFKEVWN